MLITCWSLYLELHGLMVVGEAHSEFLYSSSPRKSPRYKACQSWPLLKPTSTPQHFV